MAVFAMSDLHLSLSSDKPMDIFRGWDNYVERIEKNWRSIVKPEDTVVIPGDISWEMRIGDTGADFTFINNLPGKKILLKGNHDLWWDSSKKMNDFFAANGFDTLNILHNNCYVAEGYAICGSRGWFYDDTPDSKVLLREAGRIKTSLEQGMKTGLEPILFLHYPPLTTETVCDEIMDVIREYNVKRCYYGHIHKAGSYRAFKGEYDGISFKCVSCDMLDFVPLLVN